MTLGIAGMGWVTPLGSGVLSVWEKLLAGEEATAETIASPLSKHSYPVFKVPASATADAPAHPRLRRSSAISRFAVVAGLAALKDAKVELNAETAERTALIFAISNGGVIYTKRFYHEVVEAGAQAASPLLFPETVFNAPASHLAAILGIAGASYTLVGDGAVGLLAMKMAEDLMQSDALDRCLVVATEEADWLLCDAYRKWRLLRASPPIEPFQRPPRGMIPSEGAGAVLLSRSDSIEVERIDAGCNFTKQQTAGECVEKVFANLCVAEVDLVIASANGTFIDHAEREAILRHCPASLVYVPKPALGESVGASGLWQVICAAHSLRTQRLPPVLHARDGIEIRLSHPDHATGPFRRALVSTCGLNQQVAGLLLHAVT